MILRLESEEPDSEYGIGLLLFCGAVSRTGKAREFVLFPVDGPAKRLGFAGPRVLKAC